MNSNSIVSHATLNSIVLRIHVDTIKLCNITGTLLATSVILHSVKCNGHSQFSVFLPCHFKFQNWNWDAKRYNISKWRYLCVI